MKLSAGYDDKTCIRNMTMFLMAVFSTKIAEYAMKKLGQNHDQFTCYLFEEGSGIMFSAAKDENDVTTVYPMYRVQVNEERDTVFIIYGDDIVSFRIKTLSIGTAVSCSDYSNITDPVALEHIAEIRQLIQDAMKTLVGPMASLAIMPDEGVDHDAS